MRLLLDTHLLLWAAAQPDRIPANAARLMESDQSELHFSVVSLWEVTIKNAAGRPNFLVDTRRLRDRLLTGGYMELAVEAEHALLALPRLYGDPFDRMLVAQAAVEKLTLLTVDGALGRYAEHASIQIA